MFTFSQSIPSSQNIRQNKYIMEAQSKVRQATVLFPQKSKVTKNVNYEQKLSAAYDTNLKLKQLWEVIRNNTLNKKLQASQVHKQPQNPQAATLRKKQKKLMTQIQHLTNNLNCLINQNNKLKSQVDSSRNSRVIYSNVYKNLEKEIHKHKYLYQVLLIDSISYEEVEIKAKEKLDKVVKKLEKEILELQGGLMDKKKPLRSLKSRLDTGLESLRENKASRRDTKCMDQGDIRTNLALSTKRDEITIEVHSTRKEVDSKSPSNDKTQLATVNDGTHRTVKSLKTRNKMQLAEQLNQYYDLEMKSNYYDNVVLKLKAICGKESLQDIVEFWNKLPQDIQDDYQHYVQAEEELKNIEDEMESLGQVKGKFNSLNQGSAKTAEQMELQQLQEEMKEEKAKLEDVQNKCTEMMNLNCHKLTNEEISNHILRIKRRGGNAPRQLQKMLEKVTKDRSVTSSRANTQRL